MARNDDGVGDHISKAMRKSMEIQRPRTSMEGSGASKMPSSGRTVPSSPGFFGKLRHSLDSAMNARESLTSAEEEARQRVEPGRELRKGWLGKQGKGMLAGTRWRRRYFALYPQALAYWWDVSDHAKGRAPKGVIPLEGCSVATTDKITQKENTFGVFHTTRRDFFFQGESEEDMLGWLNILEEEMGMTKDAVTMADFVTLALIGKGASGSVYQVRKKDSGAVFAMKMIDKTKMLADAADEDDQTLKQPPKKLNADAQAVEAVRMERRILEVVNHPFIVTLHFAFQTQSHLCFVMDFIGGGELYSLIAKDGRFPEPRARFYAAELVLALEYLHEVGIVYRDLKPENILLGTDGHVLITDFGQSKYRSQQTGRSSSIVGSAYYMAPEIFMKKGHGPEADWWSLGILIYEMMVGLPPCYCSNTVEAYRNLLTEQVEYPDYLSANSVSLLKGLLKVKPAFRSGAKEPAGYDDASETSRIRMKWNMPWFQGVEWEKLLAKRVEPPYKPQTSGDDDLSNFSANFTTQQVSIGEVKSSKGEHWFDDFSFVRSADDLSALSRPAPDTFLRRWSVEDRTDSLEFPSAGGAVARYNHRATAGSPMARTHTQAAAVVREESGITRVSSHASQRSGGDDQHDGTRTRSCPPRRQCDEEGRPGG